MTYIIASDVVHFVRYCGAKGLRREDVTCIRTECDLRGRTIETVIGYAPSLWTIHQWEAADRVTKRGGKVVYDDEI